MIGNGMIGEAHRRGYRMLKEEGSDIVLHAICDIRPERLEENDGANVYSNLDEMLEKEKGNIDFIDICLPTFLHKEYAIKCMKAGYDVLCEKPMALNYEDAQEMIKCSKETGKKLMIAQVCRFGDLDAIHKFVLEGKFGKPVSASFVAINGDPFWGWENWFKDGDRSGGAILDLQAHNIDLINWFFGMPKMTSTVATVAPGFNGGYSSISSNLIYEDGFYVHSFCDWTIEHNKFSGRIRRVNFEHGYVFWDGDNFVAVAEDGTETDLKGTGNFEGYGFKNEIKYFADCVKNNRPLRQCEPEESAKVITIVNAQRKSAQNNGMPVEI